MAFETEGLLSFDASDYVSGASEASDASEDLADSTDEAADSLFEFDAGVAAAGAAALGAGTALQSLFDGTRDLNEILGRTSVSMGLTVDETRDLATSMSDATFPIDDVTTTMDALAQVGVDTEEEMREVATAADALADATGSSATEVAEGLAPAVQALDGDLSAITEDADAFTRAVRETNLEMSDVSSTIERLDFDQVEELGLSAADTADLIGQFGEETGFTGRVLRREFRSAVEDADGSTEDLVAELGLGEDAMESLADETSHGSEVTTEFGDAANESLTKADELRSTFDDVRLQASGMLGPIDAAAPALQTAGIAALTMSTINISALIPSVAGVTAGVGALLTTVLPLTLALAGLVGVGLIVRELFGDEILAGLEAVSEWITDDLIPPVIALGKDGFEFLIGIGEDLADWFDSAFGDDIQDVVKEAGQTIRSILNDIGRVLDWAGGKIDWFSDTFARELEIVASVADFYIGTTIDVFELGFRNLIDLVSIGLSLLRGDWDGAFEGIENITERTWETVRGLFFDGIDTVNEITGGGVDSIRQRLRSLSEWLQSGWDFLTAITRPFREAKRAIVGNSIIPDLDADVRAVLTGLVSWLRSVWSLHPLSDTVESAAELAGELIDGMSGEAQRRLARLASWLRDSWDFGDLAPVVRSATSSALNTVQSFVSSAQSALNSLSMPSLGGGGGGGGGSGSSSSGSTSTSTGNMPGSSIGERSSQRRAFAGVATGGFIEGDGLAVLHDGERVLPETQVTDRGEADVAGGSGVTIENVTVNANDAQGGRRAGKAFRDELRRFNI